MHFKKCVAITQGCVGISYICPSVWTSKNRSCCVELEDLLACCLRVDLFDFCFGTVVLPVSVPLLVQKALRMELCRSFRHCHPTVCAACHVLVRSQCHAWALPATSRGSSSRAGSTSPFSYSHERRQSKTLCKTSQICRAASQSSDNSSSSGNGNDDASGHDNPTQQPGAAATAVVHPVPRWLALLLLPAILWCIIW